MLNICNFRWSSAIVGIAISAIAMGAASEASAAATLSLSTISVSAGTNQVININISGSDQIAGTSFYVQVNDGGTANGGTSTIPTITGLDVTTGIFSGNNSNNTFSTNGPLLANAQTTTNTGTVLDSGTLAKLTLDTTGKAIGSTFTIQFANVGGTGGPHSSEVDDNLGHPISLSGTGFTSPATITVVPEPASVLTLAAAAMGLLLPRRRGRSLSL